MAWILDLQSADARAIPIPQALGDNAFEVVRAHQLEELVTPARYRQRLENDRRPLGQDVLQAPPSLGERQRPQISAVEPDHIEDRIGGCARVSEQVIELWSALFVGSYDLTVEYRVANIE
jgi:hypothetical protein